MDASTLEPLYCIAAQALTPPDHRWVETWRWRLGNVQLDLWLRNEDTLLARRLLALMQSLPPGDEQRCLTRLVNDYERLFSPQPINVTVLPAVQMAAEQWGYTFAREEEPGLAPAFAFMAHLCRAVDEQLAATVLRRSLLADTLCPLMQATAHRLQRQAATTFYQAVGEFLPTLVKRDLAGDDVSSAPVKRLWQQA